GRDHGGRPTRTPPRWLVSRFPSPADAPVLSTPTDPLAGGWSGTERIAGEVFHPTASPQDVAPGRSAAGIRTLRWGWFRRPMRWDSQLVFPGSIRSDSVHRIR